MTVLDIEQLRAPFVQCDLSPCRIEHSDLFSIEMDRCNLRGAEISGLNLLTLASFAGMKVDASQQHIVLLGIGLDVYPVPG